MIIENLLSQNEGKTLEFKQDLSSLEPIVKTVIAFANTAGGTIVIGRSADGVLMGVDDPLLAEEKLANTFSDSIAPQLMPDIDIISYQNKSFLLIKVAHQYGPFYLKRQGNQDGVYIRIGSTTRKAALELIAELRRSQSGLSFDQMPCANLSSPDCLSQERVNAFFKRINRDPSSQHLESLGIILHASGREPLVSNGGIILFGSDAIREKYFPNARLSCARFKGKDKSTFIDRQDMEGTLIEAVEDGIKFIKRNTRLSSDIQSFKRHDLSEFPEIPMREVLINALVHTDYSLGGRIQIAIYDDRLEIQNPGLLPFGLTVEDLKSGISRIRNRTIARVFRELHLMEEWGSGYSRSIAFCTQYGYRKPEWYEVGSSIKVVFFPHPSFTQILSQDDPINVPTNDPINVPVNFELNERQRWFLDMISIGKQMRAPHLAKKWGVSEKTAKRDISFLQRNRVILFQGNPKNGHYILLKHESEKL